jgi:hypothetical protein
VKRERAATANDPFVIEHSNEALVEKETTPHSAKTHEWVNLGPNHFGDCTKVAMVLWRYFDQPRTYGGRIPHLSSTQESSKHMNFEESNLVQDLFARARKTSSKPPALPDDNGSNLRRYIKLVDSFENSGVVHCTIMDGLAPILETGRPNPEQRSFEDGAFAAACALYPEIRRLLALVN